jgi:hypothetical protein
MIANQQIKAKHIFAKVFELKQGKNNLAKGKSKLISIYTDKISQQPENCENRNDPDLVQSFLKKWWVESDFKAPNLPLSLSDIMNYVYFHKL